MARHVEHGRALLAGLPAAGRVLDLGSGGGLPGLVLATARPGLELTLLEARRRACGFLREAVDDLGVADRVVVVESRAEETARRPELREAFDAVVARSFGPPPVTAECAVGFLRIGGHLIVSEPPVMPPAPGGPLPPQTPPRPPVGSRPAATDEGRSGGVQGGQSPPWGETRWPLEGLEQLGFAPAERGGTAEAHYVRLEKVRSDDRWPRRTGIPAKRPLWKG